MLCERRTCFLSTRLVHRPLQRMGVGMLLATAAFVIAGFLQIKIEVRRHTRAMRTRAQQTCSVKE